MNYRRIFVTQYYGSIKNELWLMCLANVAVGIICKVFPMNGFLLGMITVLLGWKTFIFMNSVSIMPSISSDFDRYSWKYFQGLPLGKKDLVIALLTTNIICRLPGFVWFLSFLQVIFDFVKTSNEVLTYSAYFKCFLAGIPLIGIVSLLSLKHVIVYPRKKYSNSDPQHIFVMALRNMIVGATVLVFAATSAAVVFGIPEKTIILALFIPVAALVKIFDTWFFAPVLLIIGVYLFNDTLKVWRDEKIGYSKNTWNKQRDVPIMAVCLSLFYFPLSHADLTTPSFYSNSPLMKAVYKNDQKEVHLLLSQGEDVNKANEKGFTPLMAAAHEGNLEMFMLLENKGALYQGTIKLKPSDFHHGMNIFLMAVDGKNKELVKYLLQKGYLPNQVNTVLRYDAVHLAAQNCKSEVLDLLIHHQADLKTVNQDGHTPIHIASKNNCFAHVVSLVEAGVDPAMKDRSGKPALEYAAKAEKNHEISSYLHRHVRLPAGN